MRYHLGACCSLAAAAMASCARTSVKAQKSFKGRRRKSLYLPEPPLSGALHELGTILFCVGINANTTNRVRRQLDGHSILPQRFAFFLMGNGLMARTSGKLFESARPKTEWQGNDGNLAKGFRDRNGWTTFVSEWPIMCKAGQSSVAYVLLAVSKNFGGERHAGAGYKVLDRTSVDFDGMPSINLREMGCDATATLQGGLRLCCADSTQGSDVSAIRFPIASKKTTEQAIDGCFRGILTDILYGKVRACVAASQQKIALHVDTQFTRTE